MDQFVGKSPFSRPFLEASQLDFPELNHQAQPQRLDSTDHLQQFRQSEGYHSNSYFLQNQRIWRITDSIGTDYHAFQQLPAGPSTAVPFAISTGGYQSLFIVSQPYSEPMVYQTVHHSETKPIIHENIQIRPPTNTQGSQYKVVYNDNASNHLTQDFALVNLNGQQYMQQPPRKSVIQMNKQTQTPPILSAPLLESRNHQENSQIPHCSKSQKELSVEQCTRRSVIPSAVDHAKLQCDICGKFVANQRGLTLHIKWAHTPGSLFPCPTCDTKYYSEEKLNKHLVLHNCTENQFICEICEKQFWYKSNLNRHMSCHSDTTRFKCDKCPKTFTRKDNLVTHLRLHERKEIQ